MELENEINYEINHLDDPRTETMNEDYINLLENPEVQQYMNEYYYSARKLF